MGVIKYIRESDSDVKMWALRKGAHDRIQTFGMVFLPISCIIVDDSDSPSHDVANGDKY